MLDQIASLDTLNETDFYTVTLTAGVTYYIEMECGGYPANANANLPGFGTLTLADAFVNLFDPQAGNRRIGFDDDGGVWPDARLVFTPTVTQDYVVGATAFRQDQFGTYRIKVFEDDFRGSVGSGSFAGGQPTGTVGAVANGGTASGVINYIGDGGTSNGDVDVFEFNVVTGLRYVIDVLGAASGDGTLARPELRLLNSLDFVLRTALSDTAGSNVQITYQSGISGQSFVAVEDWHIEQGGTYVVSVSMGLGTAGADRVTGSFLADGINAQGGNDTIDGALGDDTVLGGLGDDKLDGGAGNDNLQGGMGDDKATGGLGDDVIGGGTGQDRLIGGAGADRFVFGAGDSVSGQADVILDSFGTTAFELGLDVIDLSLIDADETQTGDQAFVFDGSTGIGHIWLVTRNDRTVILGNTDGTGGRDLLVVIRDYGLVDESAYNQTDFVL